MYSTISKKCFFAFYGIVKHLTNKFVKRNQRCVVILFNKQVHLSYTKTNFFFTFYQFLSPLKKNSFIKLNNFFLLYFIEC